MKRIIAVIFVILCLCGCDMKRIRTESSIKEYETDFQRCMPKQLNSAV